MGVKLLLSGQAGRSGSVPCPAAVVRSRGFLGGGRLVHLRHGPGAVLEASWGGEEGIDVGFFFLINEMIDQDLEVFENCSLPVPNRGRQSHRIGAWDWLEPWVQMPCKRICGYQSLGAR